MMTDPIADMLTRIRNGNSINRKFVSMPASRIKVGIAEVLKNEGFIAGYDVFEGDVSEGAVSEGGVSKASPGSTLKLQLKYGPDGEKVIRSIDRVSKPGCRAYTGVDQMPRVLRGLGIYVLSTPIGVLSDRAARKENVGGEILCKVS